MDEQLPTLSPKIPARARDLREVQIEVTSKCNADCPFCINRASWASDGRHSNGLSTARLFEVIDWIAGSGIKRLRFTGGEPLLRPDLPELLEHAKSHGLATLINTNGYLVERFADALYDFADVVLISIVSTDPAITDDAMRAPGSHAGKVRALEVLREHPGVWTSTVLGRSSIEEFDALADFMVEHGVGYWILLRPEANGLDQDDYDFGSAELEALIEKLRGFDYPSPRIGLGNAIPVCAGDSEFLTDWLRRSDGAFVSEGRSKLSITPYGIVLPSYGIDVELGRVLDSLDDLWGHPFAQWIRGTEAMPKACRHCKFLGDCHGGSRIAAHGVVGRWDAPDPLMDSRLAAIS